MSELCPKCGEAVDWHTGKVTHYNCYSENVQHNPNNIEFRGSSRCCITQLEQQLTASREECEKLRMLYRELRRLWRSSCVISAKYLEYDAATEEHIKAAAGGEDGKK